MARKSKIKPCPFCGKAVKIQRRHYSWITTIATYSYGIACKNDNCGVQPCTAFYDDAAEAMKEWNKREEKPG